MASQADPVEAFVKRVEEKLRRKWARRLVRQDFFGGLHVQPKWLYVDHATGQAALERVRNWPARASS